MTVNWIRNKGVSPDDDDEDVPGFSKLASIPVSRRSPAEDRLHEIRLASAGPLTRLPTLLVARN
jgi:hypothetical protein